MAALLSYSLFFFQILALALAVLDENKASKKGEAAKMFSKMVLSSHKNSTAWKNTTTPFEIEMKKPKGQVRRRKKLPSPKPLPKDAGSGGKSKMASDEYVPVVESKTIGEVIMASVIATAIQIIQENITTNSTENRTIDSIMDDILNSPIPSLDKQVQSEG